MRLIGKILVVVYLLLAVGISSATEPDSTSSYAPYNPYGQSETTTLQRFNPVFGNEPESNQIISFIASHLKVELPTMVVETLDGYMGLQFGIDTLGNIGRYAVIKSYNSWVDYAIISAMNRLPAWGVPPINDQGEVIDKQHQIYFTFGSYNKGGTYGYQRDAVDRNTQALINEQRDSHFAELNKKNKEWQDFSDKNSTLKYDVQRGLTQEASTIEGDPLQPLDHDGSSPVISITFRDF